MAQRFLIPRGSLVSPEMPADFDGCIITARYFNGAGAQITPTALPVVTVGALGVFSRVLVPFAKSEWRYNGVVTSVTVDLTGTGATTAEFTIWRTDDPVDCFPQEAFTGTRGLIVQPYTEANVKNGVQFSLRAAWPLSDPIANGTPRKLWFKTGSKPVLIKLRELQYFAEELEIQLFKSPTGVTGGTDLTVHNYNGVAPVATTIQAKKNVATTSNGTEFDGGDPEYFFGSNTAPQRTASSIPTGRERVLSANTEFLVVISNTGSGSARAQYFLDWYEGGTDLPIGP